MSQLIVGFGEALVDVLPSGEVVGGAPLNFSIRAAQLCDTLGWTAAIISRVGRDERGDRIRQQLQATSLDTSAVQVDENFPTGFVDVTLRDGHPSYVIGEKVAWDHIAMDDQVTRLAENASAFCFGTLAQREPRTSATLAECLRTAKRAVKIFDINLRKPYPAIEVIEASLDRADVLKCNEEELLLLAQWLQFDRQDNTPQAIAAALQQRFDLTCVFWTRGSQGCVLQRGERLTTAQVPVLPQAPAADSVGAGDAASAALAVGLVATWPDEKIARIANYCGAFAASQRGATSPFPSDFKRQLD